jgi:tetratricopeptide (TPR) repeat protein
MQNYRNAFLKLAIYYYENGRDSAKVVEVLDRMESKIPNDVLPMDYRLRYDVARLYDIVGAKEKFMKIAKEIEPIALEQIKREPMNIYGEYNPYVILVNLYEMMGEYKKAIDILNRVLVYYPQQYQHLIKERISRLEAKMNEGKK